MKVVVLSPWKVFVAGALSCLLIMGSVLGGLALWDMLRPDAAQAVQAAAAVGQKQWFFAEGYTGPGFEEWILIYNPEQNEVVSPNVNFYGPGGFIGFYSVPHMAPGTRVSINVNQLLKDIYGYEGDVSIEVYDPTYPFLCERALYFNYKGQITGGSQAFGYAP